MRNQKSIFRHISSHLNPCLWENVTMPVCHITNLRAQELFIIIYLLMFQLLLALNSCNYNSVLIVGSVQQHNLRRSQKVGRMISMTELPKSPSLSKPQKLTLRIQHPLWAGRSASLTGDKLINQYFIKHCTIRSFLESAMQQTVARFNVTIVYNILQKI